MSKDDKSNKNSEKKVKSSHSDFDDLLKQEQDRMAAAQKADDEIKPADQMPMPEDLASIDDLSHDDLMRDHDEISSELDDLLDSSEFEEEPIDESHLDDLGDLHDLDHEPQDLNAEPEVTAEHEEELKDLEHALGESQSEAEMPHESFEEQFGAFDDSTEFNIDDEDNNADSAQADVAKGKKARPPKQPGKGGLFSGGMIFYVIILVVIIGGIYLIYDMFSAGTKSQPVQQQVRAQNHGVGFRPPVQKIVTVKQKLPPAVPQNVQQIKTTIMGDTANQILSGTGKSAHYQRGANGITLLQVNRTQLAQLLENFKHAVKDNNKQIDSKISSLKTSLSAINQTQGKAATGYTQKLAGIDKQINGINQKFDVYNKHMSSINKALTKTQTQLKLILAERAENIDRFTLRAVVPGRAWLVDDQGKTTTLRVGQKLKDYGKVVEINNKMGFVKMSSGFVFK